MPVTVPTADLVQEILYLLTETFESPVKNGNAYLDKGTGIFMTLDTVSAEDASKPAFPGATTLAAQTEPSTLLSGGPRRLHYWRTHKC